jgi:hypothetical protein
VAISLAWNPSVDLNVSGYKIYYGTASHAYNTSVDVGNVTNATIAGLSENVTYYFAATTYDASGAESAFSAEAVCPPANTSGTVNHQVPTLDPIGDLSFGYNSKKQITVGLSGITAAIGANQKIKITATSGNPKVVPNPTIQYASPKTTGTLTLKPAANTNGTAVIAVTASAGTNFITRTFAVRVAPNRPPTLDIIGDASLGFNSSAKIIDLTGISPGAAGEVQALRITATSGNPKVVPNPTVRYASPKTTGALIIKPAARTSGTAIITVTVNDGAKYNNLAVRTFSVVVLPATASPPPATLAVASTAGSLFSFTVNGETGTRYTVQASSDMKNWTSVATNTAPFTFEDADTGRFTQRFYRTVTVTPP